MHQLKCFLAAADTLHFRKAAESLNMTQSALSQQIAKFEAKYNVELFWRTSRSVQLTPLGKRIQSKARRLLNQSEKLEKEIALQARQSPVRIGYLEYQNLDFVHKTLKTFAAEDDGVKAVAVNTNADKIVDAVLAGKIDLGIVHLPIKNADLQMTPLRRGRWGFVLPKTHRLATKNQIEAKDLHGEKLLMFQRELNPSLYDSFFATLRKTKSKPKVTMHLTQSAQGSKLAADGTGIFFVASYVVKPLPEDVVFRSYAELSQEIQLGLIWRKKPTDAIRRVIDELKRHRS